MKLGRVRGSVVSTIQVPWLDGHRLLLCDLLTDTGEDTGRYTIAVDVVGAGSGERVLILDEGSSARQVLRSPDAPVRAVVVGVVDAVDLS